MADITVLAFPEVTSDDGDGIIYLIQGTGATRDKKIQVKNLIGNTLEVTATGSVDLSSYGADLVLFANSGAAITITFSNYLGAGKQIQIVGVGAGLVTLAGTITDVVIQNEVRKHVSSGTAFYNRDNANLKVDTISERTAGAGVTIDGVLLKDNDVIAPGKGNFSLGLTCKTDKFATGYRANTFYSIFNGWFGSEINIKHLANGQITTGAGSFIVLYIERTTATNFNIYCFTESGISTTIACGSTDANFVSNSHDIAAI